MVENKVSVIASNLLVQQEWRLNVFPLLCPGVSQGDESTLVYFSLFHEATLLSILEVLFFNKEAVMDIADGLKLSLVDYCARWLHFLLNEDTIPKDGGDANEEDDLQTKCLVLHVELAFKSLGLLRYFTDCVDKFDIAVLRRILSNHDMICSCVRLMLRHPWQYSRGGKMFKFDDGAWRLFAKNEEMLLSKTEVQVWIVLYNLLVDPACRQIYHWTDARKSVVEKIRTCFCPHLFDQVPILQMLHRSVEEGLLSASSRDSFPFIEEIIETPSVDYEEVCKNYRTSALPYASNRVKVLMTKLSSVYDMDNIDDILPGVPVCAACGLEAASRCSRCKNEWYCGRECQVKSWKDHKSICDVLAVSIRED
eukprot:Partr_v1_DN25320_c0_g1_i2_m21540 putative zinc finger, MYND-type containing 10